MNEREYLQMLLIFVCTEAALSTSCEPGAELMPHNLTCDAELTKNDYSWKKDNRVISICFSRPTPRCDNYDSAYRASFDGYISTLTIYSVTRQNEGIYTCADSTSIVCSCSLITYARPQSVTCQIQERHPDMLNFTIVCTVIRTRPSPLCQFIWFKNGIDTTLTSPQVITYQNLSQGELGYFYQTCTLTYPIKDLGTGSHAFRARAYTNFSGRCSDKKYGVISDLTSCLKIAGTPEKEEINTDFIFGLGLGLGISAVFIGIFLCIYCLKGNKKNPDNTNRNASFIGYDGNQDTPLPRLEEDNPQAIPQNIQLSQLGETPHTASGTSTLQRAASPLTLIST